MNNKLIAALIAAVILIIGIGVFVFNSPDEATKVTNDNVTDTATTTAVVEEQPQPEGPQVLVGKSVEGRDIVAYNYGTGEKRVLLIGGVHGGYSWNTAKLGYETVDYLKEHPEMVPAGVTVTVIPVLNPDGLVDAAGTAGPFDADDVSTSESVLTASRFNANKVDLSRNFDCGWKADAVWQSKPVSGGSAAFSEPEAVAIKNYVESHPITAAVVWYSAAGGVYASSCSDAVAPETAAITDLFAKAAEYSSHASFDAYPTSGDLVNWLAKVNVPAISVLLTNHTDTELSKNMKGIEALIKRYAN